MSMSRSAKVNLRLGSFKSWQAGRRGDSQELRTQCLGPLTLIKQLSSIIVTRGLTVRRCGLFGEVVPKSRAVEGIAG
jgi:hypothetical protein